MHVRDYCDNVSAELMGWKVKMYDVMRKLDKVSSGDKEKVQPYLNDIHMYELPLDVSSWVDGCKNREEPGIYNDKGLFHPMNAPGKRKSTQIISFMDGRETWEGTAAELLGCLNHVAEETNVDIRSKMWPKAPHMLSRRLKEVEPNLLAMGVKFCHGRAGRRRPWSTSSCRSTGSSPRSGTRISTPNPGSTGWRRRSISSTYT